MALRLMRLLNRRVAGREYNRWRIGDFPQDVIDALGWDHGAVLTAHIRNGRLIIEREK